MVHRCPRLLPLLLLGGLLLSGPPGGAGQTDIPPELIQPLTRMNDICGNEAFDELVTALATATATAEGQGSRATARAEATAPLDDCVIDWSPTKHPDVCPDSCQAVAAEWGKECAAAIMFVFGTLWNQVVPGSTAEPDALAVACGWQ